MPHLKPQVSYDVWIGQNDGYWYSEQLSQCTHTGTTHPPLPRSRGRDVYFRQASTYNPKSVSGWRDPAPYSHGRRYCELCQSSDTYTQIHSDFDTCGGKLVPWTDTTTWVGSSIFADDSGTNDWYPVPTRLTDRALTKALLKLQDQKVNLAQNLVERRQTAGLLSETAHRLYSSLKVFRQRNPKLWHEVRRSGSRKNFNSTAAGREWLKYQYGWKPLISDIYGSLQLINDRSQDHKSDRVTVIGNAREEFSFTWEKPMNSYGALLLSRKGWWRAHASLSYRMNIPIVSALSQVGITNPLYVAWEEIPYSFVVDWFLPVGNWINSWTADYGFDFLGGSMTLTQEQTDKGISFLYRPPFPNYTATYPSWGSAYGYGKRMSRSVYSSSPVPGIHLKNPLSSLHVSEALALLQKSHRLLH